MGSNTSQNFDTFSVNIREVNNAKVYITHSNLYDGEYDEFEGEEGEEIAEGGRR